jgi:hypothetical protein
MGTHIFKIYKDFRTTPFTVDPKFIHGIQSALGADSDLPFRAG